MKTDNAMMLLVSRRNQPSECSVDRHMHSWYHARFLVGFVLAVGIVLLTWALALPSNGRTLPSMFLSLWGVACIVALPMDDTAPVVLLCLGASTAELPGLPVEEIGPMIVVGLWVVRSLVEVLLRRGRQQMSRNASVSAIIAVFGLLACNLVVMGYRGIAPIEWVKNALPWMLCLTAYPVALIRWTQERFGRVVDVTAFAGAMVSVADIVQFMRAGGIAGAAEVGGEAFVSMLPLLAIVAILYGWERSHATVYSAARRLCLLAAFAVCLARIVMSLQRAWLIGAVVGLVMWIWAGRSRRSSGVRRLASTSTLALSLVIAVALVAPASQLLQSAYQGFLARIGRSWISGSFDYSIGTRLVEVTAAIQSLRDSPWFGTGLGSFIDYVRPNGVVFSVDYVHIGPVFVLTKFGVVGFGVFAWLVVRIGRALRWSPDDRNAGSSDMMRFLVAELCVVGALFMATRYVFKPTNAALVWLLIGMAFSLHSESASRDVSGADTMRSL